MKAVLIGESSGASRDAIMAVYPRHRLVVDKFVAQGVVLGIGPFSDGGNMAIFKTRAAAEAFSKEDPFILEGLVKSFVIKDWAIISFRIKTVAVRYERRSSNPACRLTPMKSVKCGGECGKWMIRW
jgi:uncharacterized protein YciI